MPLVRQGLWRRWALATVLVRLPGTMTPAGLLIVGSSAADSVAVGAQLAGAAAVASGVCGPLQGRWLDGRNKRTGLQVFCLFGVACLLLLMAACLLDWGVGALMPIAVGFGFSMGPIAGGMRALLPLTISPAHLSQASAVEPVVNEAAFIAGPAIAGVAGLIGGPVAVLAVMALLATAATAVLRPLPTGTNGASAAPQVPWKWRELTGVYTIVVIVGCSLGLVIAALPVRVEHLGGSVELGGGLLSLMAVGSALAGIVTPPPAKDYAGARRRAVTVLLVLAILPMPLTLLPSVLAIAFLLPLCGAPIAPLYALGTARLQEALPSARLAEGFTRYASAVTLGTGAGQALAGLTVDSLGPATLFLASGLLSVTLATVLMCRRG